MTCTKFAAIAILAAVCWPASNACAQPAAVWNRLDALIGTWDSAGDTQLGGGDGSASFTRDLDAHVIVRRSFAEYKSGPQAGTRHDDLLVIYREAPDGPPRAIYFDSEGHVIRYAVTSPRANAVVFQSDGSDPGPRYRLSYVRAADALDGTFEIAMPGGEYKTYLSWTSKKR
jgi:hypothetical protein